MSELKERYDATYLRTEWEVSRQRRTEGEGE